MADPTSMSAYGLSYVATFSGAINAVASLLDVPATAIAGAIAEEASELAASTFGGFIHAGAQWNVSWTSDNTLITDYRQDLSNGTIGASKSAQGVIGKVLAQIEDPLGCDIGVGNLNLGVALNAMNEYFSSALYHGSDGILDPLGLNVYANNYGLFAANLMSSTSPLSAEIEGLNILAAENFLTAEYSSNFTNADDATKAALLTTISKIGPNNAPPAAPGAGLPDPTSGSGGAFVTSFYSQISTALSTTSSASQFFAPVSPISYQDSDLDSSGFDPYYGGSITVSDAGQPVTFSVGGLEGGSFSQQTSSQTAVIGSLNTNYAALGPAGGLIYEGGPGSNTFQASVSPADGVMQYLLGENGDVEGGMTVAEAGGIATDDSPSDIFNIGAGAEIVVGGSGNNTFNLIASFSQPTLAVVWGAGGSSNYNFSISSATVSASILIVYINEPTLTKILSLSAAAAESLAQSSFPDGVSLKDTTIIINPLPTDTISLNGKVLQGAVYGVDPTPTNYAGLPGYVDDNDIAYIPGFGPPQDGIATPTGALTVGAVLTGSGANIANQTVVIPQLNIANFVNGDFGITLAGGGQVDSQGNEGPVSYASDFHQDFQVSPTFFTNTAQQTISVGSSGDTLSGGDGNDFLTGSGDVTYDIGSGDGVVLVASSSDPASGVGSTVDLDASFSPDAVSVNAGGPDSNYSDIIIQNSAGDGVDLVAALSSSTAPISQVNFSDGTVWSYAELLSIISAEHVIDSQGASSYETGNGDGDTFIYNQGYGHLSIFVSEYLNDVNILTFGAGIGSNQITAKGDASGDIVLTDEMPGDQVTLEDMLYGASYGVQLVQFADGTSLTAAQIIAQSLIGTVGADTLFGTSGADMLDGKGAPAGSQDYEQGNAGADTFTFNEGYGHLEINEDGVAGDASTLLLGPNLSVSELQFTADRAGDLYVTDGTFGDRVEFDSYFSQVEYGPQTISFADGSTLTRDQILVAADAGTSGANILIGTTSGQVFDGEGAPAGSEDYEQGSGGADTLIYNAGYGELEINEQTGSVTETGSTPSIAVLRFGSEITVDQLSATIDSSGDLILSDGKPGDEIKIDGMPDLNYFGVAFRGIAQADFADGTSVTRAQLLSLVTASSPSNTLVASQGDSTINVDGNFYLLEGGSVAATLTALGNYDTLEGGSGASTLNATGNDDTLIDGAGGGTLTASGDGNVVQGGAAPTTVFIDGYSNTWSGGSGTANLTVYGDQNTLTAGTGDEAISLSGNADIIDDESGNDDVTISGDDDQFIGNFNATSIAVSGSGNTVTGSLDAINVGEGASLSVTGYLNNVQLSVGDDLTYAGGSSRIFSGSDETISLMSMSGETVAVYGSYNGNNDYAADGATTGIYVQANSEASIYGDFNLINSMPGDSIDLEGFGSLLGGGADETIFVSQTYGQGDDLFVSDDNSNNGAMASDGETAGIFFDLNTQAYLFGSGNAIQLAAGDSLWAEDGGGNVVTGGQDEAVTLGGTAGSADTAYVSGDASDVLTSNNQTAGIYLDAGAQVALNGSQNSVFLQDGASGTALTIDGTENTFFLDGGYSGISIANLANSGAAANQISFTSGAGSEQLWLTQSGSDLDIEVLGNASIIDVKGWFASPSNQLQTILSSDSLTLDTGVMPLVHAMATYAANNPGFNPATASVLPNDPTLQSTVTSVWHH